MVYTFVSPTPRVQVEGGKIVRYHDCDTVLMAEVKRL